MSTQHKYSNILISSRADKTLSYSEYIKHKPTGESLEDVVGNIFQLINAKGFTLDMSSSQGWIFTSSMIRNMYDNGSYKPFTVLSFSGYWYGQDVTNNVFNVHWSRDTGNTEEDAIWNNSHKNIVNDLPISYLDVGADSYAIGSVTFKCEAEFASDTDIFKASRIINL